MLVHVGSCFLLLHNNNLHSLFLLTVLIGSLVMVNPSGNKWYAIMVPPGYAYIGLTSKLEHAVLRTPVECSRVAPVFFGGVPNEHCEDVQKLFEPFNTNDPMSFKQAQQYVGGIFKSKRKRGESSSISSKRGGKKSQGKKK